jgi:hypothetical protein
MTKRRPTVCVLPQHAKLGFWPESYPLDAMEWPLGQPEALKGKALRALGPDDHLIMHPRTTSYFRPTFGTPAKVSVMVVECASIHQRHIDKLHRFYRRFHKILSVNQGLLDAIPNGVFFPFGSTWVPDYANLDTHKSRDISLIASAKRSQAGHIVRHDIIAWADENKLPLDAIGGGYRPFEKKSDGLAPYRFSVVIENVRERGYFTEKLIDCILCDAVPIYFGCPNIGDFMDTSGMILCDTADDIQTAILQASAENFEQRLPHLKAIKPVAAHYGEMNRRAAAAVLE